MLIARYMVKQHQKIGHVIVMNRGNNMKLKKIPKDFIICDGMTEQMGIWDYLLPFALLGVIGLSYVCFRMYQYIREKKQKE